MLSQAFKELKDLITKTPVLGVTDAVKLLNIQADSSNHGIRICLRQSKDNQLHFHLKPYWMLKKSAQIKEECFNILFIDNRFYYYIICVVDS